MLGLNHLARACFRPRLLVLCYHGVCGTAPDEQDLGILHVPRPLFEAQLQFLLRSYQPVSLAQVHAHYCCGAALPPAPLLFTFDDVHRNIACHALPRLRQLGVPSVLFPVLERLRREPPEPLSSTLDEPAWLDWEQLARLAQTDTISVGSHGMHHQPFTNCNRPTLAHELDQSRQQLRQRLRVDVEAVAYPFGCYSPMVTTAARQCGYRLGFTTDSRHAGPEDDALVLPRITVSRADSPARLAARMAGWMEWLRGS